MAGGVTQINLNPGKDMSNSDFENAVKKCYSTWSESYYDDYYSDQAAHPPVHLKLLKQLLAGEKVSTVLDAGCGPASFLRTLAKEKIELFGFDLTPEMVAEARKVLGDHGIPESHVWEGSVLSADAYRPPGYQYADLFDAALCIGVLPHIPAEKDVEVICNLRNAVKQNGLVVVEARNQLFALFTLNRYSYSFFKEELIQIDRLKLRAGERTAALMVEMEILKKRFRMDQPPIRKGKENEPGYDEVLSRTHNPFILKDQFVHNGLKDVRVLFYHYHCLPPLLSSAFPEFFQEESLAMEDPEDWRGHFMASAFLVAGRRK